MEKNMEKIKRITYPKIYCLFIVGSLLGIVLEGLYCLIKSGQWETHVVTVWEPLCIIFGVGLAGFYIGSVLLENKNAFVKFVTFASVATAVEFISGFLLEYGLNMRAWDYTHSFMNVKGYICIGATLIWGTLGMLFSYAVPFIDRVFDKVSSKPMNVICIVLSVFLAVDLTVSAICFDRWSERHRGIPASSRIERIIDASYGDSFMEKRFCEWRFIK